MKKFTTLYLDMDGVLADFHQAALLAHGVSEAKRHEWPNFGQDLQERLGLGVHDHTEDSSNIERFWGPINIIQDFWLQLEKFEWVAELLILCNRYAREIVICTSPASSWNGEDKRQKLSWLSKCGIYREVKFCSKKAELSKPGTLLIDDWEKQVDPFHAGEGQAILFPQPWNRNYSYWERPLDFVHLQLDVLSE